MLQGKFINNIREGHLDVCHLLVEKGSDLNVEDKYGQNCIYYSIREGRTEVVDFLIKQVSLLSKF